MQRLYLIILILFVYSCKTKQPVAQKHLISEHAMVVSAHPLASDAGIQIIKQGGNAVDAMVTTNFVLAVTYPRAGNIGGGGFMIIRLPDGTKEALDYREMAPASAHKDMYLDSTGNVIPKLSTYGGLASGVPGTVAGLYAAWKKYGKIKEWKKLIEPAIEIAKNGFPISQAEADRLNKYQADFIKYNPENQVFIKEKWQAGDRLKQTGLAHTLQLIADNGPKGFYEGEVAEAITKKIKATGGQMQLSDLKNYQAKFRKPIVIPYKNYTVISMPPPSSGGIALGQLLKITENYPLKDWGYHSYKSTHLIVEAEKRVYADRAKYLGDSDFYPVPIDSLLNDDYLKNKMKNMKMDYATPSDSIMAGGFQLHKESFETTHISIVDSNGMATSCTTTLNSNYGSKVIVDSYGFFLNNEMDDFSAKPGVPNQFGLIGAEANAIAPRKRMLSSMTPSIVEKDGHIFMVLGTPGGSTIITSVFQTILNVIEYDMDMYDAVQSPRFHHQFLPDVIMYENKAFTPQVIDSLQQSGQKLKKINKLGYVKAILVRNNKLEGSGDERNPDDDVSGY